MFEKLTDRLTSVFRNLTGRGSLTEANIDEAMREVRRALLEADVNYRVTKEFVDKVRADCIGETVLKSIAPGQMAIKIVNDRLTELLGAANVPLELTGKPTVIMLVGLHGSGKTTTAAKLANLLQNKQHLKVMLAACDLRRPAAIDQLEVLGKELQLPVYLRRDTTDVLEVAAGARRQAVDALMDVLILDTAGRLQVDEELVQELVNLKKAQEPKEILLVADAALGQEAVSVAEHFNQALEVSGIILTKLDGDARGGAALSMRHVTGKPIKFVGVGERIADLEPFFPERMASRILGMGDIVSLVEKAAEHFEEDEARQLEEKMRLNSFTLDDFLGQIRKIRKMGGMLSLLDMFPGARQIKESMNSVDERQFNRIEGVICGMTPGERDNPGIINTSRRRRIAAGSGVDVVEVNQLLKRFEMMREMLGQIGKYDKLLAKGGKPPPPPPTVHQNPILMKMRHGRGGRRWR